MLNVFFSKSAAYLMKKAPGIALSENVVSISFQLDVGDISQTYFESNNAIDEKNNLSKVMTAAAEGKAIRIWKSQSPHEVCGFAFLCHQLRNISCDLRVVSLPEYVVHPENTVTSYSSWKEVHPDDFSSFLKYEQTVTVAERKMHADQWQTLQQENSPLRALVNGQLLSVPENFYDHLLLSNLPEGEFVKSDLIAVLLGKYQLGVSDAWYAVRIDQMIQDNLLTVHSENKKSDPCHKTIKKIP